MRKADAIAHFGSVAKVAEALGINRSAVYQWPDRVPYTSAIHLERITEGKLKAPPPPRPGEAERRAAAR